MFKSGKIPIYIILIFVTITVGMRWLGVEGTNWKGIIRSDGEGYYQYLNALFIEKNISSQKADGRFLLENKGGVANIYSVGPAVLISPFFAEGYFYQWLFMDEIDKYGLFFQLEVSLAALFYFFISLLLIRQTLIYYNIRDEIISLILVSISFGTNLLYYTIFEPSMSHVYSFFTISLFVYSVKSFSIHKTPKTLVLMSLALGLTILIRPVNILVVIFIPFLLENVKSLKSFFISIINNHKQLIISILIFFVVIGIQPLMWKLQTGNWFIWSYKNSGFYFDSPEIFSFLFSFRKGWFIYTPIALLSFAGLALNTGKNKYLTTTFVFAFILLVYFLSSWWNWYYGDSFGMRPMIDYYSILFVPLAIYLNKLNIKSMTYRGARLIISVLIVLNLIQTYQYYHNIMSKYDMNFEKYKYIFLKTSSKYENVLGGNIDIKPYHSKPLSVLYSVNDDDFNNISKKKKYYTFSLKDINIETSLFIEIDLSIKFSENYNNKSELQYHLRNRDDNVFKSGSFKINDTPEYKSGKFLERRFEIQIPPFHKYAGQLEIVFSGDEYPVIIKDVNIKISHP